MDIILNETRLRVYRNGDIYRWKCDKKNGIYYKEVKNIPSKSSGYNFVVCNKKTYRRHRIIAYCFLGLDIDDTIQQIDHIDRNRINNHINNLRIVSHHQNQFNRTCKGYYLDKHNKYIAQIRLNGNNKYLGYYNTEEEA